MRRPLLWAAAVVIAVAGVLIVVFAARFGEDIGDIATPLIGEPVADLRLPYLEGEGEVALAHLEGEIVVVNFWASWCIPCRAEHPILLNAAADYAPAAVRVVGIVYQDDPDAATAFLDEFGRGYEVVTDEGSRAAIEFGVFGVPETFFIDREGAVAFARRGPVTAALMTNTLNALVTGGSLPES